MGSYPFCVLDEVSEVSNCLKEGYCLLSPPAVTDLSNRICKKLESTRNNLSLYVGRSLDMTGGICLGADIEDVIICGSPEFCLELNSLDNKFYCRLLDSSIISP